MASCSDDHPMTYLLHDALRGALASRAACVAIDQEGAATTYGDLAARANQVAHILAKLRLGGGGFVGLSSTVTADTVAAAIGILTAGMTYVPLDVQSPPDRLREIVADAGLQILVVDPVAYPDWEALACCDAVQSMILVGADGPRTGSRVIPWSAVLAESTTAPPTPITLSDDLAYVLYTSGSTGVPKGVMLTHRNARTFVDWMAKEFRITPGDRVASRAPFNFDLSVFDVFNTLAAGATLLIKDRRKGTEEGKPSAQRHIEYVSMLREKRATVLYTTPSTFVTLLDKGGLDRAVPLRLVMYAGEPFPPALLRKLMAALPDTRVANIYGPTETNIVTYHWVNEPPGGDAAVPIGREVDDTEIVIVSDDGRPCEPDEPGEIWVRGGTVCVGYFGKDDLTRKRLVDSPFHPYPAKFWRTGDYGKRHANGTIVYHGRIDNMIKTRGHRVELGDVESALAEHPLLSQAIVVPKPHASYGNTLHAFVLPRDGAAVEPGAVMRFLATKIPEYMLPRQVIVLWEYPYTSTGKVDRQRLIRSLDAQ
jgi:amino acid adenylation domain-containing protein